MRERCPRCGIPFLKHEVIVGEEMPLGDGTKCYGRKGVIYYHKTGIHCGIKDDGTMYEIDCRAKPD